MAWRNRSLTLYYRAWDTEANAPITGDVANHTLRVIKDGTASAPTNSPAEVDATNCPGEYKLVLTAAEMNGENIRLAGKSSTTGVVIFGDSIATENAIAGNVNDAGAAAGDFDGNSGLSASDDFYNGAVLIFTSGTLSGMGRRILDYTGSSRNIALETAFPTAPTNGDTFVILGWVEP